MALIGLTGCDLQPKIVSLPDSVGAFIAQRYPALLADPEAEPEIYNSAAIDYGVYASPDLYGSESNQDYVLYASVDDYIVPPQENQNMYGDLPADKGQDIIITDADNNIEPLQDDYLVVPARTVISSKDEITVVAGDTLYSLAQRYGMTVEELAQLNNLSLPYTLSVGQKLQVWKKSVPEDAILYGIDKTNDKTIVGNATTTKVALKEITVNAGDTLYSLSRAYSIPVNDLAVMNNLAAPFTLSVGQKLKVPNLAAKDIRVASSVVSNNTPVKTTTSPQEKKKISSDPNKKLPKLSARSSSKFSWPVKGKILSNYGAKSGGLFNDGINIGAAKGTAVKSAENGVVAYAGNEVKGMGNLIIIQHSGGWMTVYAHMDSMIVRRGTKVNVGQQIGTVGETGKVDEPQLHFEIRKGTKAYNPSSYLK